jgi:hypothetical protein
MFARVLGAVVASLMVAALAGVGYLLRPDPRLKESADNTSSLLARRLNKTARDLSSTPRVGWVVTKATSAQHMMVVNVDAERLEQARGIAIQIVDPVRSRGYDEILVYVRQPGRRVPAVRRVQWTPRGGFVETTFVDR